MRRYIILLEENDIETASFELMLYYGTCIIETRARNDNEYSKNIN